MVRRWESICAMALCAALAGCVSEPLRYGEVVVVKPGESSAELYPTPGTVWRLDEAELKRLSPAPYQEPPPPPRRAPSRVYYPPPPPPPWFSY
jgi:hypothetical protein